MANQASFGEVKFCVGDTIGVHYKLIEKEKVAGRTKREVKEEVRERIQVFEGLVISIRGMGDSKTFTVRRIAVGAIGVERIFPLNSPWIKKITVIKSSKVRRAKIYYIRKRVGRGAEKLKERKNFKNKPDKENKKKNTENAVKK